MGVYLRCLRQVEGKDWWEALQRGFSSARGCACGLGLDWSPGVNRIDLKVVTVRNPFSLTTHSSSNGQTFDCNQWLGEITLICVQGLS